MVFLLVGSFWFWHWYLLWALVLAVLLPTSRFTRLVLPACCLVALWAYIASDLLLRRWRPATPLPLADHLSAALWVALTLGALALGAFWRVTSAPQPLAEDFAVLLRQRRRVDRPVERPE